MADAITQLLYSLGGAGLGSLLMWKWLNDTIKGRQADKEEFKLREAFLQEKLTALETRERETTEKVIEALLLNKKILEGHQEDLGNHYKELVSQYQRIESLLTTHTHEPRQ